MFFVVFFREPYSAFFLFADDQCVVLEAYIYMPISFTNDTRLSSQEIEKEHSVSVNYIYLR
jgi:hypothetical protein